MKFIDYVTITVRSGAGGAGAVAFRREKYVPRGGPAGGDGGRGGSVYIEADKQLYTLLDLRYNRHHFATAGEPGGGSLKKGKDAEDIVLRVPCGTIAVNSDTNQTIGEVIHNGDRLVLARGGKGGRGNAHFKSSTNQAPQHAQPGRAGEEVNVTLELKLLADVGLVGLPNAGKSTLVATLSAARPKVADYPFTTLQPNLGTVFIGEYRSFVLADIPGIIEGAHQGKGLGHFFLKHIERNAALLYMIPIMSEDPVEEFELLREELRRYNPELLEKPGLVAVTKMDLLPEEEAEVFDPDKLGFPDKFKVVPISSISGFGIPELKDALWTQVEDNRLQMEEF